MMSLDNIYQTNAIPNDNFLLDNDEFKTKQKNLLSKNNLSENVTTSQNRDSKNLAQDVNKDNTLTAPSNIRSDFDASTLNKKLDGFNSGADVFNIMSVIHQLFIQMRRQAAESKQDAYRAQWTSLENKAVKMEDAAKKEFAAAMVNGAIGLAGSAAGLRSSGKALRKNTNELAGLKKELNAFNKPKTSPTNNAQTIKDITSPPSANTNKVNGANKQAVPENLAISKKPTANTNNPPNASSPNVKNPHPPQAADKSTRVSTTKSPEQPTDKSSQPSTKKESGRTRDDILDDISLQNASIQSFNAQAMAMPQIANSIGTMASSPITYAAGLDRAESQRQDAEATKAQADVESEAEFVRNASEGMKSVQSFLDQFITSMAQVNNKIMA